MKASYANTPPPAGFRGLDLVGEHTPDVLRGKPRIKGTRIPVSLILGYLAAGSTFEDIIKEFPDLTNEQIAACLDYARDLSEFEVAV